MGQVNEQNIFPIVLSELVNLDMHYNTQLKYSRNKKRNKTMSSKPKKKRVQIV